MATVRKNKDFNPYNCPVTHTMNLIGGKWKMLIMYAVGLNCNRFSKLQRALPLISKQMLVNQLRELEQDGILERTIYPEVPPRVEYKLSERGQSLTPVIAAMQEWGLGDLTIKK
jgi:DNA-binding HxlR family transcriptional regulator